MRTKALRKNQPGGLPGPKEGGGPGASWTSSGQVSPQVQAGADHAGPRWLEQGFHSAGDAVTDVTSGGRDPKRVLTDLFQIGVHLMCTE